MLKQELFLKSFTEILTFRVFFLVFNPLCNLFKDIFLAIIIKAIKSLFEIAIPHYNDISIIIFCNTNHFLNVGIIIVMGIVIVVPL